MSISVEQDAAADAYASFFERLPTAAMIVDRDCTVLAANAALRRQVERRGGHGIRPPCTLAQIFAGGLPQICSDLRAVASSGGRLNLAVVGDAAASAGAHGSPTPSGPTPPSPKTGGAIPGGSTHDSPNLGHAASGEPVPGGPIPADPVAGGATPGSTLPSAPIPGGPAPVSRGAGGLTFRVTPARRTKAGPVRYMLVQDTARPSTQAFADLNLKMRDANEEAARQRRLYHGLQETYRELEQFSYAAAHDLKAPLRNISLLLGFLKEDHGADLPPPALEMVEEAGGAARRLQSLIDALLGHARLGTEALNRVPTDLDEMLDGVAAHLAANLAEAGGQLCRAGRLGVVMADRKLLNQLLENLVGNALKYCAPDRPPRITVSYELPEGGRATLRIRDNGIGFDPAESETIFTPFQRLHSKPGVEGSGIGLATCRNICNRHGWTLGASGVPGEGATFSISGLEPAPDA
ncbi:hypothetical protein E0K89_017040 [Aquicoccus sp. SCR17]|nr:hypothetical protein [Carideicomes alvinocaridis]